MAEYVIQGETLTEIADAIREKKYKKSEYTQLEYIESNGTQYIDTGYYVTSEKLKIVSRFMLTELRTWAALWGVEGSVDKTLALTPMLDGLNNMTFYSGSSTQRGAIPVTTGEVYNLTCQTINGAITYQCNGTTGSATAEGALCKTDSFYVFTLNSASDAGALSQASKMRLYSFQMYDNDVLVRDLVPCVRTDGILGLYDLANDVFYTNAGTGSFTAGSAVGSIEDEPVPIPTTSMAAEILSIETGINPTGTKAISTNGTHDVAAYANAQVNVSLSSLLPIGMEAVTSWLFTPDSDFYNPSEAWSLEHKLGVTPNFYAVFASNTAFKNGYYNGAIMSITAIAHQHRYNNASNAAIATYTYFGKDGTIENIWNNSTTMSSYFDNKRIHIWVSNDNLILRKGVTYRVVVGRFNNLGG